MKTLCVFTPTYNRAHLLCNLYDSLVMQTCTDFEWLIVDDGSTDSTSEVISDLQRTSPFPITYLKQENGGKQRAHNTGVQHCENELFVCVDSDDVMPPHAIEAILKRWEQVRNDLSIAGIIALCGQDAVTPLVDGMPDNLRETTMWDLYYKHGHRGDTSLTHRTSILKQYPFVVADGEKFIAETYVYHQIDQVYRMAVLDQVVIVREYLPDGYTHNVRAVTMNNPLGYVRLKKLFIEYSDTLYLKLYNSILYMVGCMLGGVKHGIKDAPYPAIAAMATVPAWILCKTVYKKG